MFGAGVVLNVDVDLDLALAVGLAVRADQDVGRLVGAVLQVLTRNQGDTLVGLLDLLEVLLALGEDNPVNILREGDVDRGVVLDAGCLLYTSDAADDSWFV